MACKAEINFFLPEKVIAHWFHAQFSGDSNPPVVWPHAVLGNPCSCQEEQGFPIV